MAKNVRLGVLRARHDTNAADVPDSAFITMMMTGEYSVFAHWADTTRGHFDFVDSALLPWVTVTLGADTSRVAQAQAAVDALRAADPGHDPIGRFDGLVVLTYPGKRESPNPKAGQPGEPATITQFFDGGAASVAGKPVCVLPMMSSDHTFMCHETGHVLGLEHSFGLDNNGTDWDPDSPPDVLGPEYGSPHDLMSSAPFGSRWLGTGPFYSASPTFAGPVVTGWPHPGAFSMGPHMSRANLHRWVPEALAERLTERAFPVGSDRVRVRLRATSTSRGRTLLILHPPGEPTSGVGRVYVEYRVARGWDAGLDQLGPDLSREGVVVHSLAEVSGVGPRVWYQGVIPSISIDSTWPSRGPLSSSRWTTSTATRVMSTFR